MSLKICSLSSGSSGNCIYVTSEKTKLLIDCGIPITRIEKSLEVLGSNCDDLSVLITHAHFDHVSGLSKLTRKYDSSVHTHFMSSSIKGRLGKGFKKFTEFGDGDFYIGDLLISPFKVSHDVPTVGFMIFNGNSKISVMTDLGNVTEDIFKRISDSGVVLIESNHDKDLLLANPKYAPYFKRRILSDSGHLSNSDCADVVSNLAKSGVKQVILAHLSKENNYPELAFKTVAEKLKADGIAEGADICVEVAPAERMSGLFEVC